MDDRPTWARRITVEREARGWDKPSFIAALRAHAPSELPSKGSLLQQVHAWESGASCPDDQPHRRRIDPPGRVEAGRGIWQR